MMELKERLTKKLNLNLQIFHQKEILISEKKLMGLKDINLIILRLGGLVGVNRNPIFSLAKKDISKTRRAY